MAENIEKVYITNRTQKQTRVYLTTLIIGVVASMGCTIWFVFSVLNEWSRQGLVAGFLAFVFFIIIMFSILFLSIKKIKVIIDRDSKTILLKGYVLVGENENVWAKGKSFRKIGYEVPFISIRKIELLSKGKAVETLTVGAKVILYRVRFDLNSGETIIFEAGASSYDYFHSEFVKAKILVRKINAALDEFRKVTDKSLISSNDTI